MSVEKGKNMDDESLGLNDLTESFFFAIWTEKCWNCHSPLVVGYNLEGFSFILSQGNANLWKECMRSDLLDFLKSQGVKIAFRTTKPKPEGYYANVCPNCSNVFGDYHLHETIMDNVHNSEVQDTLDDFKIVQISNGKILQRFANMPECDKYIRNHQHHKA